MPGGFFSLGPEQPVSILVAQQSRFKARDVLYSHEWRHFMKYNKILDCHLSHVSIVVFAKG